MIPVIVDSNVLLDVVTSDPTWGAWSSSSLERAADEAILIINALLYAEVSIGFDSIEALEEALPPDLTAVSACPTRPPSWPGRHPCAIGQPAGPGVRRSRLPDRRTHRACHLSESDRFHVEVVIGGASPLAPTTSTSPAADQPGSGVG